MNQTDRHVKWKISMGQQIILLHRTEDPCFNNSAFSDGDLLFAYHPDLNGHDVSEET